MRKLVYGIGINDSDYMVSCMDNGKGVMCPYYRRWENMLERCYSSKYHEDRPTYIGCTVTKEWLTFSNFRSWMVKQNWEGKQLDKDILSHGTKIYSPDTCVFISSVLNKLLLECGAAAGKYPIGAYFEKNSKKFKAQCRVYGKNKHLGYFDTPEDASEAYKQFKSAHILEVANTQPARIKKGLIRHANLLLQGVE